MTGKDIRKVIYTIITVFFSMGAVNCSDTMHFIPESCDEPIVNLMQAGNDVILSQGFTLNKDMKIKLISLGEGIFDDLSDYGWIIDADTREKVWIMTIEHSKNAGGAKKNRLVEEDILLKKGNYVAFYKTDDSHSFERWNDTPPADESRWGLSMFVTKDDDIKFVSLFNDKNYRCKNLVAEIVRVRDDDFRTRTFKLENNTKIKIYAIGEGTRSEMFDYGWIEDEEGNIIWMMEYKNTRYAGGAVKNRLAEDNIILPAGEYTMYYKTDDSHSFNNWNANPPEDVFRYGLTLTKEHAPLNMKHAGD